MSYFLFIDESGHDLKESPYYVLAGVSVEDRDLWNLIKAIHESEIKHFGRRYSQGNRELKGKKILTNRIFQHAGLNANIADADISALARECLDDGAVNTSVRHMKGLALAKIRFVEDILDICLRFRCQAFASIVDPEAEASNSGGLRKDYGYLFERFYYFLDDQRPRQQGIIVFDETEKSQSHLLINQAHTYFKETATGRLRSNLVIPEPFFVHSDLTTGIQLADIIAYIISWGFRTASMDKPARPDLQGLAQQVARLRYQTTKKDPQNQDFTVWSFAHITDLRTRSEREDL